MNTKVITQGFLNMMVRRFIGPFWYRRAWLERTQWFSREKLEDIQFKLLKRIVKHSESTVPYYKTLMRKQGFSSENMRFLSDIKLLPILSKEQVLNAGDSIISSKYKKWMLRHAYTGGTTGTPLNIYRSPFSIGSEHAFVRRQWDWAGIKMSDRTAYLTGRILTPPDQQAGKFYAFDPFMKELILSSYHLNENNAKNYIKKIKKYKCIAIIGYPSAVYYLAQVYKHIKKIDLAVKVVLTSSETLSKSAKKRNRKRI